MIDTTQQDPTAELAKKYGLTKQQPSDTTTEAIAARYGLVKQDSVALGLDSVIADGTAEIAQRYGLTTTKKPTIKPIAPKAAPVKYTEVLSAEEQSKVNLTAAMKRRLAKPGLSPEMRKSAEQTLAQPENQPSTIAAMGLVNIKPTPTTEETVQNAAISAALLNTPFAHADPNMLKAAFKGTIKGAAYTADFGLALSNLMPSVLALRAALYIGTAGKADPIGDLRRYFQQAAAAADVLMPTSGLEGYLSEMAGQLMGQGWGYSKALGWSGGRIAQFIPKLAPAIRNAFTGTIAQRVAGQIILGAPLDAIQIATMPDVSKEDKAKLFAMSQAVQAVGAAITPRAKMPYEEFLTKKNEPVGAPKAPEAVIKAAEAQVAEAKAPAAEVAAAEELLNKGKAASSSRKAAIDAAVAKRAEAKANWEQANPTMKWDDLSPNEKQAVVRAHLAGGAGEAPKAVEAPAAPQVEAPPKVPSAVQEVSKKLGVSTEEVKQAIIKTEPTAEPVAAPKRNEVSVTVEGKTRLVELNETQKAAWDTEASRHDKAVSRIKSSHMDPAEIKKQLKAEGMKHAAAKREISGALTAKEQAKVTAAETKLTKGKSVTVKLAGKELQGTILNNPVFGKVDVQLESGAKIRPSVEDVTVRPTDTNLDKAVVGSIDEAGRVGPSTTEMPSRAGMPLSEMEGARIAADARDAWEAANPGKNWESLPAAKRLALVRELRRAERYPVTTQEPRTAPEPTTATTRETPPTLPESQPRTPQLEDNRLSFINKELDRIELAEQDELFNQSMMDVEERKMSEVTMLQLRQDKLALLEAKAKLTHAPDDIYEYTKAYFEDRGSARGDASIFNKYQYEPPLDPNIRTEWEKVPTSMLPLEKLQRLLADAEGRVAFAEGAEQAVLDARITELRQAITDKVPRNIHGDQLLWMAPEINGAVAGYLLGFISAPDDEHRRSWALGGAILGLGAGFGLRYAQRQTRQSLVPKDVLPQVKSGVDIKNERTSLGFSERLRNAYINFVRPHHATEFGPLGKLTSKLPAEVNPRIWGELSGQYIGPTEGWIQGQPKVFTRTGELVDVLPYTVNKTTGETVSLHNMAEILGHVNGDIEGLGKLLAARQALYDFSQGGRGQGLDINQAMNVIKQLPENYHIAGDAIGYFHEQLIRQMVEIGRLPESMLAKLSGNVRYHEKLEKVYGLKSGLTFTNPVESFINLMTNHMRAAESHMIDNMLMDLYEANPEAMRWYMRRTGGGGKGEPRPDTQVRVDALRQQLKDAGTFLSTDEARSLAVYYDMGMPHEKSPKHTIWRDGAAVSFIVTPQMNSMLNMLRPVELSLLARMTVPIASFLRAGIVNDPVFIGWMAFRDQWQAALNSRYGFKPFLDGAHAVREAWMRSPDWKAFQLRGGGHPALAYGDVSSLEQSVKTALNPGKTAGGAALAALKQMDVATAWRTLITPVAESGRFGEYLLARGAGASEVEAAFAARQVVGNLQMIGASARALSMMTPFLRASAQALDQTVFSMGIHPFRGARELIAGKPTAGPDVNVPFTNQTISNARLQSAKTYAALAIGTIAIPSAILWAANKNNVKIEEHRRGPGGNRFWYVALPDEKIIKIPKPIFDGEVWGTSTELVLDKMFDDDPVMMGNWIRGVLDDALFNIVPTWGAVPAALLFNRDLVSNAPITPMGREGASPSLQIGPNTSLPAQTVGKALDPVSRWIADRAGSFGSDRFVEVLSRTLSPAGIDFLVRNFGGTLRSEGFRAIGAIAETYRERDVAPMDEWPVIRRSFAHYPTTAAASLHEFYVMADKVDRVGRNIAILIESNDAVGASEEYRKHPREAGLVDLFRETRAQFAQYRQSIEDIRNSPFSSSYKKKVEDQILEKMILEARDVVKQASVSLK